jgi:hypothetical protein
LGAQSEVTVLKLFWLPTLLLSIVLLTQACPPGAGGPVGDDDDGTPTPTPEPTAFLGQEIAEVEPNDESNDWQDLGTLGPTLLTITGTCSTAGHDPDGAMNPTGDLDVYVFELEQDGRVDFELSWSGMGEDFDAVLYDNSDGPVALGFDSPDAIDVQGLASTDNPESATYNLDAGTSYALMIANWEGSDGAGYTMTITVERP